MPQARTVFHAATAADWAEARRLGVYRGSALCRRDGFIHMSTRQQLGATLARFFAGRDDLVLLAVDTAPLGEQLRWEDAPGVGVFPHYYGAMPLALLRELGPLALARDGTHILPPAETAS